MIYKQRVTSEQYIPIRDNKRPFVICKDDKPYKTGDTLIYQEFDDYEYTGKEVRKRVAAVDRGHEGVKEGYVVLTIEGKIGRPRGKRKTKKGNAKVG